MGAWLATTPLGRAFKTFLAVIIAAAVADFSTDGNISLAHWQTWVIGGLVSALPPVISWLNPADARFGLGAGAPVAVEGQ